MQGSGLATSFSDVQVSGHVECMLVRVCHAACQLQRWMDSHARAGFRVLAATPHTRAHELVWHVWQSMCCTCRRGAVVERRGRGPVQQRVGFTAAHWAGACQQQTSQQRLADAVRVWLRGSNLVSDAALLARKLHLLCYI